LKIFHNKENQTIHIFGDGLSQAQVGVETSFIIDARSFFNSNDEIKVIQNPSKDSCDMQVINNHDGTWIVNYTPTEIGEIPIDIFLGDKHINSSPYQINVFDINQIHVLNLNDGILGQLVKFDIDASKAGIGQLEIIIQDGLTPCHVIPRGSSQFDAAFLPQESGGYKIDVRFNGLSIPGN
jgi:filamin